MMRRHFGAAVLTISIFVATTGVAQEKNQLAVSFGRTFVSHQTVPGTNFMGNSVAFGAGLSVEANYSRVIKSGDLASLSVEIPALLNLDQDLNYGLNIIPEGYRSYFVTPSARLTLFPNIPVSPWGSLGGGVGHFSGSSTLEFGGANPGKTGSISGVLQIGAGVDIGVWRSFALRGEFRDFYSGVPQLNVKTGKSRQHNLFVGVGVVWHFGP